MDLAGVVERWPVGRAAVAVVSGDGAVWEFGEPDLVTRISSVSKLFTGVAALVALEDGVVALDEEAGPPGSTVEHLLAHASGLPFDGSSPLVPPGRRRIYSNTGVEVFARHLEQKAGSSFAAWLETRVTGPLGLATTSLQGSPAKDVCSSLRDLSTFARELLRPRLVHDEWLAAAASVRFPELKGRLPGVGSFDPCPWGLTFEIKGAKEPHWMGRGNSPRAFGHFGGSGAFLWVDPEHGIGCVALTDREFGHWALAHWPEFSDAVLTTFAV